MLTLKLVSSSYTKKCEPVTTKIPLPTILGNHYTFANGEYVLSARNNNGSKRWNLYLKSSKGVIADASKYVCIFCMRQNTHVKCILQDYWKIRQQNWYLKGRNFKIKKELTDLRESVQYHIDNIDEVNKKLEGNDRRNEKVKLYETAEDFVTKTKKKLADLKDGSRRNNLRFDGF